MFANVSELTTSQGDDKLCTEQGSSVRKRVSCQRKGALKSSESSESRMAN